jgi:hypothetical protein
VSEPEKVEGYEFTEEQLLEILNFLEEKRKLLFKHPESPDHVAMWQLEQHIITRLNKISWDRYQREKGIKITKV